MENNVNCKDMRLVIRNLVDVDDVSLATAPEIPFDVCLNYVGISPEEGMMQHSYGRYFAQ